MRKKFNYDELVEVSGIGRIYGEVKNKLGFVIEKDAYYNDYYVDLIFGKKDWFEGNALKRAIEGKVNRVQKHQIRLCTTNKGYEIIKQELNAQAPISNNKFSKINIKRKFERDKKQYIILGWNSTYWPISNKSIKILEKTLETFRKLDIPFQYVVMNNEKINDIEIYQFIENDSNVDVFFIESKVKIKNNVLKENNENVSKKNFKCNE